MPRIQDELLDSIIYLYPSVESAWKGERTGGTGFILGYPTSKDPTKHHLYAVTNRHVIEDGQSPVIRLNTHDGNIDVLPLVRNNWITHRGGEDIAACFVESFAAKHKVVFFSTDWFVTERAIKNVRIGPGDDVFILGRFVNHEGKQFNQPSARFGHISMLPGEPIRQDNGHLQVSFAVEAHSIGGYSGSPVFVEIPPRDSCYVEGVRNTWFLGVDWGHIIDWQPLLTRRGHPNELHPEGWGFPINTGMIGVVPAWQLLDLLNEDEFVEQRRKMDNEADISQNDQ